MAPVPNLPVIVLPYDRDSIIAALEAKAPSPRPDPRVLDSLFQLFREPYAAYAAAAHRVEKLRDSLDGIKRRLDSLPRDAPGYREAYLRFGAGADSLAALERQRDQRRQSLERARRRLTPRIDSLRAAMRRWEAATYSGYDSLTSRLVRASGRQPISDSTDSLGRLRLQLARGRWWIYARSWDAQDPNREWYWNLPLTGDSVVLDDRSGRDRPRY